jgi:hypothetical protein
MRTQLLILFALLAAACAADQERRAAASDGATVLCDPAACGPALGMPNWICADGSTGGPTGRCIEHAGGQCGWEIHECPSQVRCGPESGRACSGQFVCVDLPGDGCTFPTDAGCDGVCVAPVFCGGIAGLPCPDGRACVDDPRDGCAPPHGADCGGLCAP